MTTHNFDILCVTNTFLDSVMDLLDENINISGYSIFRVDDPSNNKSGAYFRQSLSLIRRYDLSTIQNLSDRDFS